MRICNSSYRVHSLPSTASRAQPPAPEPEVVSTIDLGAKVGWSVGYLGGVLLMAREGYRERWTGDPISGAIAGALAGCWTLAFPASILGGLAGATVGLALQPFFGWPPPEPPVPDRSVQEMADKIRELSEEGERPEQLPPPR